MVKVAAARILSLWLIPRTLDYAAATLDGEAESTCGI
jgi:hypothetical protein